MHLDVTIILKYMVTINVYIINGGVFSMRKSKVFLSVFLSVLFTSVVTVQAFASTTSGTTSYNSTEATFGKALEKSKSNPFPIEAVKDLNNTLVHKKIVSDPKSKEKRTLTGQINPLEATSNGIYPTRKGVILVTADKFSGIIPLGHSAIVYSSSNVVESLSSGVVMGKNNWDTTRNTCAAGTVTSTTADQDAAAAEWCKSKIGLPYNYDYYNMSTRSKFYCSQLVWASFEDNYGIDLNTSAYDITLLGKTISAIHPTELLTNDKVIVTYRNNWSVN